MKNEFSCSIYLYWKKTGKIVHMWRCLRQGRGHDQTIVFWEKNFKFYKFLNQLRNNFSLVSKGIIDLMMVFAWFCFGLYEKISEKTIFFSIFERFLFVSLTLKPIFITLKSTNRNGDIFIVLCVKFLYKNRSLTQNSFFRIMSPFCIRRHV